MARTVDPERHAARRREILDAAAVEFAAHGFDGTSTAKICRRADIGSGTLFHYFSTKRTLFRELFREGLAVNEDVRRTALEAGNPDDGLRLLIAHVVADLASPLTPGLAAAAILQSHRDLDFALLLGDDEERTRATITALVEQMASAGRMLPFSPARTAHWICRLIDACYLERSGGTSDDHTQIGELHHAIDLFTRPVA